MRVLVIGGAGYIGSHVARELLDNGYQVTVFDNLSMGLRENLFADAAFVEGDILDPDALGKVMSGGEGSGSPIGAIVHLAALKAAGQSMVEPSRYAVNNINGTINILAAAEANKIDRLVFSSSAAVYGEPNYLPVDEKHPLRPENFYGFTKLEIERILAWYDKLKGMRYAALRYFNAAGYDPAGRIKGLEQKPANLLPVILEVAAGMRDRLLVYGDDYETPDGTGIRDYIHVSDLASAHLLALQKLERADESFTVNLGSESGASVMEILEAARRITGRKIPADIVARRPGDPARLVSSASLAKELLGWQAKQSDVDSLVATTWAAYQSHMKE
ncbi:MAG TPA: UDP-glucose 4-epimerase GalE [Spirochaetia bacterium]|nr:UDP-glucose 4-epimerase GalE [Spirochaetia bacterium]